MFRIKFVMSWPGIPEPAFFADIKFILYFIFHLSFAATAINKEWSQSIQSVLQLSAY